MGRAWIYHKIFQTDTLKPQSKRTLRSLPILGSPLAKIHSVNRPRDKGSPGTAKKLYDGIMPPSESDYKHAERHSALDSCL